MSTKQATVRWVDDDTFIGTDSTDHSVVLSSGTDNVGMRPSQLLMVALGSCSAVDVVGILQKKKYTLHGVDVTVSSEQSDEGWPRPYTAFHIHFTVSGPGIKEEDVQRAIELSEGKYCSVAATLRPGAQITADFEVVDTSAAVAAATG